MAAAKPKIIQIINEQTQYLLLLDDGRVFRTYSFAGEVAAEEVIMPDFSKTQPKITKKGTFEKHHARTGK